jgi:hypothetical protein
MSFLEDPSRNRLLVGDPAGNRVTLYYVPATALTILQQPQAVLLRPGSNATFNVVANSATPISYQWRFNGNVITGAVQSSLTMTNVQQNDTGVYDVLVSDQHSSLASASVTLDLLLNPVIVQAPLSLSVVAGGSATFSVQIAGNPPPFTYEWRHLVAPLFTNISISNERMHFFTLSNVTASLAGNYRVVVRNAALPSGVSPSPFNLMILSDSDADGLPDAWEADYNVGNAGFDDDGDGLTNLQEYQAGTNPTNAASTLRLSAVTQGGLTQFTFPASVKTTYTVQFKNGLENNWSRLADFVALPTNSTATFTDSFAGSHRYYRVVTPAQPSGPPQ